MKTLQVIQSTLAALANLTVVLIADDLYSDPRYGFGIFLIFGLFIPLRMILILSSEQLSWSKRLVLLLTSTSIFLLAIYWGRRNEDWALICIMGIAAVDGFMDFHRAVKTRRGIDPR